MMRVFSRVFLPTMVLLLAACTGPAGPTARTGPVSPADYDHKIRVACVGDSITAGRGQNSYPAQLQRMLGDKWEVKNFGVSGATMMNGTDRPYQSRREMQAALDYKPDVVLIMLGTNDSRPTCWKTDSLAAYEKDCRELVQKLAALESKPRIFLLKSPPLFGKNLAPNNAAVTQQTGALDAVARAAGLGVIDVNGALQGQPKLFSDNVHPTSQGATVIAETVYSALTGSAYKGPAVRVPEPPRQPRSRPATAPAGAQK